MSQTSKNERFLSICAFSFMFAYILSFLFEGQVLYSVLDSSKEVAFKYVFSAIIAHFFGQFTCGFLCKTPRQAKITMLLGMGLCFILTIPFFFDVTAIWLFCLLVAGYAAGLAVAS